MTRRAPFDLPPPQAFGFYIAPDDLEERSREQLTVPYHYWEADSRDEAARVPSKPWTFPSHNYEIESARLRHMAGSCLLVSEDRAI